MEAGADLEEGADPALEVDLAFGGGGDAREDLQEGALAGAVPADDAHDLALLDLEVDVLERPESIMLISNALQAFDGGFEYISETLREGLVGPVHPDIVLFGNILEMDDWFLVAVSGYHLYQIREVFLCILQVKDSCDK